MVDFYQPMTEAPQQYRFKSKRFCTTYRHDFGKDDVFLPADEDEPEGEAHSVEDTPQ